MPFAKRARLPIDGYMGTCHCGGSTICLPHNSPHYLYFCLQDADVKFSISETRWPHDLEGLLETVRRERIKIVGARVTVTDRFGRRLFRLTAAVLLYLRLLDQPGTPTVRLLLPGEWLGLEATVKWSSFCSRMLYGPPRSVALEHTASLHSIWHAWVAGHHQHLAKRARYSLLLCHQYSLLLICP